MQIHTSRLMALLVSGASLAAINSLHLPAIRADPPDHAPAWGWRARDDGFHGRSQGHGPDKDKKDKGGRFERVGQRDDDDRDDDDDREGDDRDYSGTRRRRTVDGRAARVNLDATVLEVLSSTELRAHGDNGQNYRVRARAGFSSAVSRGDRVRLNGTASGGLVTVERVVLLRNGGSNLGGNPGGGQAVNFAGRVVRVELQRNVLLVRGDNGSAYAVRSPDADSFRANDRIRVIGTYANGMIAATRLIRL